MITFFLVVTIVVQASDGPKAHVTEIGPLESAQQCEVMARSPHVGLLGGRVLDVRCVKREDT